MKVLICILQLICISYVFFLMVSLYSRTIKTWVQTPYALRTCDIDESMLFGNVEINMAATVNTYNFRVFLNKQLCGDVHGFQLD